MIIGLCEVCYGLMIILKFYDRKKLILKADYEKKIEIDFCLHVKYTSINDAVSLLLTKFLRF